VGDEDGGEGGKGGLFVRVADSREHRVWQVEQESVVGRHFFRLVVG
jgi:hypothetical protein